VSLRRVFICDKNANGLVTHYYLLQQSQQMHIIQQHYMLARGILIIKRRWGVALFDS
jgi:hypothetical protein